MADRMSLYGRRLVRVILALQPVQRYRLQRAYLLDAYDQFPGLRQRMLILWLKLAPVVIVVLSIQTIDLPVIARLGLALACAVCFVTLYAQANRIRQEDNSVLRIHRLNCEQSKFLRRSFSR